MNQQKAFYELPKPKWLTYMVWVQVDTDRDYADCMEPGCTDDASDLSVYQCAVCARWFCLDHINKDGLCKTCVALPVGIAAMVVAFREELHKV